MGTLSDDCGQGPNSFDMVRGSEQKTARNGSQPDLIEPKSDEIRHRCTVEFIGTGRFCNRFSVDHAPFPICARHARELWQFVDDLIATAEPLPPSKPGKRAGLGAPWNLPLANRSFRPKDPRAETTATPVIVRST